MKTLKEEKLKKDVIDSILIYNKYLNRDLLEEMEIKTLLNLLHPSHYKEYKYRYDNL